MKNFSDEQKKLRCPCRSRDGIGNGHDIQRGKEMKPSKERPWIEARRGKGGEGDLDICGEELSTTRQ
jgi:hypothetical protein